MSHLQVGSRKCAFDGWDENIVLIVAFCGVNLCLQNGVKSKSGDRYFYSG